MTVINAGNNPALAKLSNRFLGYAINVAFERDEAEFARALHTTARELHTQDYGTG